MTTDPTPLQERIARAIHKDELDGEWTELLDVYRLEYLATAAAVLPIIADEVRKAQADALREAAEGWRQSQQSPQHTVRMFLYTRATDIEKEN